MVAYNGYKVALKRKHGKSKNEQNMQYEIAKCQTTNLTEGPTVSKHITSCSTGGAGKKQCLGTIFYRRFPN